MHWNYVLEGQINWSLLMLVLGSLITYLFMKYKTVKGIIKNLTDFDIKWGFDYARNGRKYI